MASLRLGKSLLSLRLKQSGKTQEELAEYLGVNQSFISRVANNKKQFSYEQAAHTAFFLGCKMEDLREHFIVR